MNMGEIWMFMATLTQIGQVALMTGHPQVVMHLHLGVQWSSKK